MEMYEALCAEKLPVRALQQNRDSLGWPAGPYNDPSIKTKERHHINQGVQGVTLCPALVKSVNVVSKLCRMRGRANTRTSLEPQHPVG